jgi:hypothetical protein
MTLNFNDSKNEITNNIKNSNIIQFVFGNIFTVSFIIVIIIFLIIINKITVKVDDNNKLKYSYNISSIILYSLIVSIISLSIHDKLIKEQYLDKSKTKTEIEFADMMVGSAEKLILDGQKNNGFEDDIERFLQKT